MNTLVESVTLIDANGNKKIEFSNLKYFQQIIGSPELKGYTCDFKDMQKNDLEIKEEIISYIKHDENYEIIKDNIERAKIICRPSNTAEMIFNNYRGSSGISINETNNDLREAYKKMGFIGK